MKLDLNIAQDIFLQFSDRLKSPIINNTLKLNNRIGKGVINKYAFGDGLEFYHFNFTLDQSITLHSFNPKDSDWILINVNLSKFNLNKEVNRKQITVQKNLPVGMLFYTPDTEVVSTSSPNKPFEVVLFKFNKSYLNQYDLQDLKLLKDISKALVYEDFDIESEKYVKQAISDNITKMSMHSSLLMFLNHVFLKLKNREIQNNYKTLHPADIKGLFMAASQLRDPKTKNELSVQELAIIANMGLTKFKATFKQVFGETPIKYNHKIKMEYAFEQLKTKQMTPSQLSYEIGYSHPSKFTKAFKKFYNRLPSSF